MSEIIGWSAAAIAVALAPFYLLLASVLAAAVLGRREKRSSTISQSPSKRFLIIIPAHDEQDLIATTVRSCQALDYPPDLYSIHVIADNCTDRTAEAAREAGARVYERFNVTLKSKGHALEEFFSAVPEASTLAGAYDAAVIVDADTALDDQLLRRFSDSLDRGHDWIQAYYTVSNADATWRTRLMTYAFSLTNGVWMLGLDRLGLSVGLKGNGMCFSRQGLSRHPWRAHGLVEDMEFALMLREAGERIHFLKDAIVRGEIVSRGGSAAESQRIRWESGRKSLRESFLRPIVASTRLNPMKKIVYIVDLYFPPLGRLAMATVLPAVMLIVQVWMGRSVLGLDFFILDIYAGMMVLLALYALSPLVVMDLPVRYLSALLALPYFLFWKAFKTFGRKPASWIRTPREVGRK
ncbi:glycosyltransferase family 2 protein (plasmid) [Tundrisphaera sp. TA3]|uniref:glycosyltransferase family 2 protein n=1 Tax=Tundrisphaera sp. TA3 TaxID=3435775 RepID=UPI003EB89050